MGLICRRRASALPAIAMAMREKIAMITMRRSMKSDLEGDRTGK
jgi:hypothetical protein